MQTQDTAKIDMQEVQRFIADHPEEFRKLQEAAEVTLLDKHGRTVAVTDKVVTPQGERGMVIRIDKNSKRVLIRLDNTGKTRMLMAHRVSVRRGRPRKDDLQRA